MDWKEIYRQKYVTPEEAVRVVRDGDVVHIGTCSTIAYRLLEALYGRKEELRDVTVSSAVTTRIPQIYRDRGGPFRFLTYFAGPAEREAMKHGNCDYTSLHLSRVDQWCSDFLKDGVAFLEVSPPDEEGYMSYGAYGAAMHGYVREACSRVVLQVNPHQPYTFGQDNRIHVTEADFITSSDDPMPVVPDQAPDEALKTISEFIVDQVPDGATIQLGLGGLSGAVGYGLEKKSDLGVHSEMFTNSMRYLMEKGVITNKNKNFMKGKAVAAFALGPQELYDFIDHNGDLYFAPYTFVNDPYVIARNDNFISVNTAMAADLYGQVAADNMEGRQVSAAGGQVDYVRGAQMSKGGKSFIALPSLLKTKNGFQSRICVRMAAGTAVTTSRQDVQYIVTEYGCVNLKPLTMRQRVQAMIGLAHPNFRAELTREAQTAGLL